jgi:hypothetical protein
VAMSRFVRLVRSGPGRVAVAGAAVVFGVGVWLVGIPTSGASAASQPSGLDHFLCYKITSNTFTIPSPVTLTNQFSPSGFQPTTISSRPKLHCNPTYKVVPTGFFPITNPEAHLLCFKITESTQPTPRVTVTNQFGQAQLQPAQPNLLCLPSWKSLTGPPNRTPVQPPGLDHFTCYPVSYVPGGGTFAPPAAVSVQDQFAGAFVGVTVGAPQQLCVPTQKTVNGVVTPITNPQAHLLCFAVTKTPTKNPVWDQNQFGTAKVGIIATKMLCLPSFKTVPTVSVSPPTGPAGTDRKSVV